MLTGTVESIRHANRLLDVAQSLINTGDLRCYDLAAMYGQQFENVRDTEWFLLTLARQLDDGETLC